MTTPSAQTETAEPSTLIERLRSPLWVHSDIPVLDPQLSHDETLTDLTDAANTIERLTSSLAAADARGKRLEEALKGYTRFITMMHEMAGESGYKSGIALAQERCRKELDRIDAALSQTEEGR